MAEQVVDAIGQARRSEPGCLIWIPIAPIERATRTRSRRGGCASAPAEWHADGPKQQKPR